MSALVRLRQRIGIYLKRQTNLSDAFWQMRGLFIVSYKGNFNQLLQRETIAIKNNKFPNGEPFNVLPL